MTETSPEPGWRRARGGASLSEVFGSISTRPKSTLGQKLIAFLGPGYLAVARDMVADANFADAIGVAAIGIVHWEMRG